MTDSLARAREWIDTWLGVPGVLPCNAAAREKALVILLDTAVRKARVQALENAATECDRHAEFLHKEAHNGGDFRYLIERLDEASYLAARLRFLKGQP